MCIVLSSQSHSIKDSNDGDSDSDDDGKWQCLIYYLLQREWKAEGKLE